MCSLYFEKQFFNTMSAPLGLIQNVAFLNVSFQLSGINSISCYIFNNYKKTFFIFLFVIKDLTEPKYANEH